jgi:hypothetical protein
MSEGPMATLTEMVAAVVMHSSAVAFSHFGVTVEAPRAEQPQPAAERVIARTPRKTSSVTPAVKAVEKVVADCPEAQQAGKSHKV